MLVEYEVERLIEEELMEEMALAAIQPLVVPLEVEIRPLQNDAEGESQQVINQLLNELADVREQLLKVREQCIVDKRNLRAQFQSELLVILSEEQLLGLHNIRVWFWTNELIQCLNALGILNIPAASNCCIMLKFLFTDDVHPLLDFLPNNLVEQLLDCITDRIIRDGSRGSRNALLDCGVLEDVVVPILQANSAPYVNHGDVAVKAATMVKRLSWTEDIETKDRLAAVPGLLRALFTICVKIMDPFICKEVCNAILFLQSDSNIVIMMEAGCASLLVTVLQLNLNSDEIVVELASQAIHDLLHCNGIASRTLLLQAGAHAALIAAMNRYPCNNDLKSHCPWAVQQLS